MSGIDPDREFSYFLNNKGKNSTNALMPARKAVKTMPIKADIPKLSSDKVFNSVAKVAQNAARKVTKELIRYLLIVFFVSGVINFKLLVKMFFNPFC